MTAFFHQSASAALADATNAAIARYRHARIAAPFGATAPTQYNPASLALPPRRPETAPAALRLRQFALPPFHRLVPRHDHLRNPVARVYGVRLAPQVQQDHAHFAPVARVDGARRIRHGDRVPQRQPAPRPHLRLESRRHLDGEAGRNQTRHARRQRGFLHRAQVHACVLFGSVSVGREHGAGMDALDSNLHSAHHAMISSWPSLDASSPWRPCRRRRVPTRSHATAAPPIPFATPSPGCAPTTPRSSWKASTSSTATPPLPTSATRYFASRAFPNWPPPTSRKSRCGTARPRARATRISPAPASSPRLRWGPKPPRPTRKPAARCSPPTPASTNWPSPASPSACRVPMT